jgi:hypothetical protein
MAQDARGSVGDREKAKRGAARRPPLLHLFTSATAAGRPASAACRQAGSQLETGAPGGLDEIQIDGLNLFQKLLIDSKGDPSVLKYLVVSL